MTANSTPRWVFKEILTLVGVILLVLGGLVFTLGMLLAPSALLAGVITGHTAEGVRLAGTIVCLAGAALEVIAIPWPMPPDSDANTGKDTAPPHRDGT